MRSKTAVLYCPHYSVLSCNIVQSGNTICTQAVCPSACVVSQPFFCFTTQLTSPSSVSKYTAVNNTSVLEFPTTFYTLWTLASHMCFQTSFTTYSCNYVLYTSYQTHSNITFTLTVLWIFLTIYYICSSGLLFKSILKTGTLLVCIMSHTEFIQYSYL